MTCRNHIALVSEARTTGRHSLGCDLTALTRALASRGHTIELLRTAREPVNPARPTADCPGEVHTAEALPTVRIPLRGCGQMALPATRRLIRSWSNARPRLVHVATGGPLGVSAMIAARILRLPLVAGFNLDCERMADRGGALVRTAMEVYLRALNNVADRTLVPTSEMKSRLRARGYRDISVVGRGVDSVVFAPEHRDWELRRSWGVRTSDPVVLYVGPLNRESNVDLVMRAYRRVRAGTARARLVIVGDGPLRSELGMSLERAVFTGPLEGAQLARHYASADLFVQPNPCGSDGRVLEAMASGLAVVAFDSGAARQHLTNGDSADLAPSGESAELVRMAGRLAESPRRLASYRRRARRIAARCTWQQVAADLEEIYARVERAGVPVVGDERRPDGLGGRPSDGQAGRLLDGPLHGSVPG